MSIYDLVIESKFYNNDKIADFERDCEGLRVGVLGGTFDPIHYAHLATAEFIRCKYKLDKIIFIPSGDPPHKLWNITNKYDRYNMVLLSIAKNKDFIAFNTEMEKKGKKCLVIEKRAHIGSHCFRFDISILDLSDGFGCR